MSNPFDFSNTPITDNTTLVARYRSTSGSEGYGGSWFRLTANDGKRYLPSDENQAFSIATNTSLFANSNVQIIDESSGSMVNIQPQNITMLELGGQWTKTIGHNEYFFVVENCWTALNRITGYADGLIFERSSNQANIGKMFFYLCHVVNQQVDFTGFRFTTNQFHAMAAGSYGYVPWDNTQSLAKGAGMFGVVEPLEAPPDTAWPSDAPNPFGSYSTSYTNYTKGWGFVGDYAEQWYNAYPPNSTRYTYID